MFKYISDIESKHSNTFRTFDVGFLFRALSPVCLWGRCADSSIFQATGNIIPFRNHLSQKYSVDGQLIWVNEVIDIVKEVPNGLGQGVHYWEPAWLNNTSLGSNCTDTILFSTDYSNWPQTVGYSRKSANMFKGQR